MHCNHCERCIIHINHQLACSICGNKYHGRCSNISNNDYRKMTQNEKANWMCKNCINIFPFNIISDNELFIKLANNSYRMKLSINCDELLFDPFRLIYDMTTSIHSGDDYDPDINYYAKSSKFDILCESKYFDSD